MTKNKKEIKKFFIIKFKNIDGPNAFIADNLRELEVFLEENIEEAEEVYQVKVEKEFTTNTEQIIEVHIMEKQ